jgi:hypothetical protein
MARVFCFVRSPETVSACGQNRRRLRHVRAHTCARAHTRAHHRLSAACAARFPCRVRAEATLRCALGGTTGYCAILRAVAALLSARAHSAIADAPTVPQFRCNQETYTHSGARSNQLTRPRCSPIPPAASPARAASGGRRASRLPFPTCVGTLASSESTAAVRPLLLAAASANSRDCATIALGYFRMNTRRPAGARAHECADTKARGWGTAASHSKGARGQARARARVRACVVCMRSAASGGGLPPRRTTAFSVAFWFASVFATMLPTRQHAGSLMPSIILSIMPSALCRRPYAVGLIYPTSPLAIGQAGLDCKGSARRVTVTEWRQVALVARVAQEGDGRDGAYVECCSASS